MSFQKNPPWQKNVPTMPNFQQQMSLQQLNQIGLFQNQLGFPANAQLGFPTSQLVNQVPAVQYSATRVNPMAFQQQPSPQQSNMQQGQQQTSKYNAAQKVFSGTGVVSKIQNDIGFIDDEVLFHKNVCVKGLSPKLGDHVLVEAAYNQNMPFKWNATRVQVLPRASNNSSGGGGNIHQTNKSYNAGPPARETSNPDAYRNRSHYSSERRKSPERRPRSRERREIDEDNERKRRREEREKERSHRPRESLEHRDRSPIRKPSPKRRRVRAVPRYMVQIPKISLTIPVADVVEIKKRYQNLYVPSDFFTSDIKWIEAFPANAPFSINKTSLFHVMSKETAPLEPSEAVLDPPDADYLYSAKVMLMATPPLTEIYKKCFAKAEDIDADKIEADDRDFKHPTRLISFLVGLRGKNETMAIGGPWSKQLDGENPQSDPTVLIRTAIRTCKALTGIDLSNCTQWYRFVELYYRRSEQAKDKDKSNGKQTRIETTVLFLPDISSIMPNRLEWEDLQVRYKDALQSYLTSREKPIDVDETSKEIPVITISDDNEAENVDKSSVKQSEDEGKPESSEAEKNEGDGAEKEAAVVVNPDSSNTDKEETENAVQNVLGDNSDDAMAQMDPKNMKVAELRTELEARNLSSKGLKNQLVTRLMKALKSETDPSSNTDLEEGDDIEMGDGELASTNNTEENLMEKKEEVETEMNIAEMDISEVTIIDEYDSTKCEEEKPKDKKRNEPRKLDEKERHLIEKRYHLPENPHIIIHPSKTAKSGKFDCTVMSLSVLLDYRPEDTKEHSFEVSLFAELFNEMLTRDFGFNIFKAINFFPPIKVKDEQKDQKKDLKTSEVESTVVSEEIPTNPSEKKDVEADASKEEEKKDKKRVHPEDSDDSSLATRSDRSRSKKDPKIERPKYVTAFPDLLLSFTYFDHTHCGYIFEKDLEDLFYTLGLNLSRSQVRKMTEKFITRDSLYYRKLTDRLADLPFVNPLENVSDDQLAQLARGNQVLKPAEKEETTVMEEAGGMIQFNGSLINIQQLLDQMKRFEKAHENSERLLIDLRQKNSELVITNNRHEKKIKDLNSDLKSTSRKLQDSESNLSNATRKYNECFSVIQTINDRVAPIISKNEKSRDRSDRRPVKDKDKKSREEEKMKEPTSNAGEIKKEILPSETKEELKAEPTTAKQENDENKSV